MRNKFLRLVIPILIAFSILIIITLNSNEDYEFYSSLHIDVVDEDENIVNENILTKNNTFEGNVLVEAYCSEDLYVDVFLIINQEHKTFSINGNDYQNVQKILIPKASNDIRATTFKIKINDIKQMENDCLLIFRVDNLRDENIVYNKIFSIERFSVIYKNGIKYKDERNSSQIEMKLVNNLTNEDMLLFKKEFSVIDDESMKFIGISKKSIDVVDLNIFLDISKSAYKSNFYSSYEKENTKMALLLLSNNKFKYLGNVNIPNSAPYMVNVPLNNDVENDCVVFGICYPDLMQSEVVGTERMINWCDVLFTQEVNINSPTRH